MTFHRTINGYVCNEDERYRINVNHKTDKWYIYLNDELLRHNNDLTSRYETFNTLNEAKVFVENCIEKDKQDMASINIDFPNHLIQSFNEVCTKMGIDQKQFLADAMQSIINKNKKG